MAQGKSAPAALCSIADLRGKSGFVMAPFVPYNDCGVLLLENPDMHVLTINELMERFKGCEVRNNLSPRALCLEAERQRYSERFSCFHEHLLNGDFGKIVLSRCSDVATEEEVDAVGLFMKACLLYPHQFIALFSSPLDKWLMATPELLVSGTGGTYETVALAGTQLDEGVIPIESLCWSDKDREEQQLVARYIAGVLERCAGSYEESSPHTVKAANLFHLRSDFRFTLRPGVDIVDLIGMLHPTPAVCGTPKEEALDFILRHERHQRRYYSGFSGMIHPDDARLYVSLRCMEIGRYRCRLYAGGGLLPESDEEREWQETAAKLRTMYRLLEET